MKGPVLSTAPKQRRSDVDALVDLSGLTPTNNAALGAAVANIYLVFTQGTNAHRSEAIGFLRRLSSRIAESRLDGLEVVSRRQANGGAA